MPQTRVARPRVTHGPTGGTTTWPHARRSGYELSLESAIRMLHVRIGPAPWDAWEVLAERNREAERVLAAADAKRRAREALETKVRAAVAAGG